MSAIAGLIFKKTQINQDIARKMAVDLLSLQKRGFDDLNVFATPNVTMASRARRTLDLTPDGAEPFTASGNRFTVALDGYVANGATLRRELEETSARLRGHGDAELIAQGAAVWGLNRLLQKLEGAFAFALWDAETKTLHLVRDRLGARPLYVTRLNDMVAFASGMRAFRTLPEFAPTINADAVAAYLAMGYIPAPLTLWNDVLALPPAHRMMIRQDDEGLPKPESYWSPASAIEESMLRGRGDPARHERMSAALAAEVARLDVPFSMLDDFSSAGIQLRNHLDRLSDKPFKSWPLIRPNGAALQTAFDALAQMDEPVSDPIAPAWYTACKQASPETPVCIAPCGLDMPSPEDPHTKKIRKIISRIPSFLRPLLPARFAAFSKSAEDTYYERVRLWDMEVSYPTIIEPRVDIGTAERVAFYEFAGKFCNGMMPGLDRIANAAGVEGRTPMADARMLDIGLPVSTAASNPDIATWLRGPLRPRVQDLMTGDLFTHLGLKDGAPYIRAWQDFLGGDNTKTRPLWALATLLAWTKVNCI